MTQEQKQLLIKDLCGRLPYEVICKVVSNSNPFICGDHKLNTFWFDKVIDGSYDVKPYLRPISSMTEDERIEFERLSFIYDTSDGSMLFSEKGLDWLNAHHFDYRGLIPMGLALEAKERMYKTV